MPARLNYRDQGTKAGSNKSPWKTSPGHRKHLQATSQRLLLVYCVEKLGTSAERPTLRRNASSQPSLERWRITVLVSDERRITISRLRLRVLQSRALTRIGRSLCAFVRPAAKGKNPQHDEVQDRDKAEEAPCSGVSSLTKDPPYRDDVCRKNEKNDQPVPDAQRVHIIP